jgi:protein-disulfide isomerase
MTSRAQIDRKQMQTRAAERATEQHQGRLQPPVGPHDHAQGTEHARVTLVEYGDYQCPYCGMAYPIVKALQEQFGTELRFVFRNFPLSELHPHALHAALAAESVAATEGDAAFWTIARSRPTRRTLAPTRRASPATSHRLRWNNGSALTS